SSLPSVRQTQANFGIGTLARDDVSSNRHHALTSSGSMIFLENQSPLQIKSGADLSGSCGNLSNQKFATFSRTARGTQSTKVFDSSGDSAAWFVHRLHISATAMSAVNRVERASLPKRSPLCSRPSDNPNL